MRIAMIVLSVILVALTLLAWKKGVHMSGLRASGRMMLELLPLLAVAFLVAGFVRVLLPQELVAKWVGTEGGPRGILLGCAAGSITPGGPYVTLPIAAGFYKSGTSVAIMVAYITAWSLWAVQRLPLELGILGPRLTLVRVLSTLIFPPIAGLLAGMIDRWIPGTGP